MKKGEILTKVIDGNHDISNKRNGLPNDSFKKEMQMSSGPFLTSTDPLKNISHHSFIFYIAKCQTRLCFCGKFYFLSNFATY